MLWNLCYNLLLSRKSLSFFSFLNLLLFFPVPLFPLRIGELFLAAFSSLKIALIVPDSLCLKTHTVLSKNLPFASLLFFLLFSHSLSLENLSPSSLSDALLPFFYFLSKPCPLLENPSPTSSRWNPLLSFCHFLFLSFFPVSSKDLAPCLFVGNRVSSIDGGIPLESSYRLCTVNALRVKILLR